MQVKNEVSGNESRKWSAGDVILIYALIVMWMGIQISYCSVWSTCIVRELGQGEIIMSFLYVIPMGLVYPQVVRLFTKNKKTIRRITMVSIGTTIIIAILVPLALQGIYYGTKENIVETEETYAVGTETIYFMSEDGTERQINVNTENDVIVVHLEQNVQPYVKVVQYYTTLTTDNQNPWGRKETNVIKEWTQYEFHLPASEVNNKETIE